MMEIEIRDKSMIGILLLEPCNFECPHCLRIDEPMASGYQLTFQQLQLCLSDCRPLESLTWIHFSGGEPTLWTEGNRDLMDLLLEISNAGFTPAFTTNGSSFVDHGKCYDFFRRYVDHSSTRLMVFLSIDTFHRNFDTEKGRAQSVDHVLQCKRDLPPEKADLLDIKIAAAISKSPESLLPDEMVQYYESLGVDFLFFPLRPIGRARHLRHLCPDVNSDKPEDLGAYQRFHQKGASNQATPEETSNREKADALALIGSDYYLCFVNDSDFRDRWCKVAQLGHLPDTIVRAYSRGDEA